MVTLAATWNGYRMAEKIRKAQKHANSRREMLCWTDAVGLEANANSDSQQLNEPGKAFSH